MNEQILANARIVLRDEVIDGHVVLRGVRIAAVGRGAIALPAAQDLHGDWLMPGLVEIHTDNLERHVMPRPRVCFPMPSAVQAHDAEIAVAGITTVFDAIGVGDPYGDGFRAREQSALLRVLDALDEAAALRAEHWIHVRCELPAPDAIELFEPFRHHRRVKLISLMDHTPGQRQWTDVQHARTYYTGRKGWSDAQFDAELARAPERQAQHAQPHRRWFAHFAHEHRIALATHDDTTVAHVDEAHALGATMSEFPTTLAAAERAHALGLVTVAGAPNVVRGGSHSGNVAALELARAGVLDALSSDYVPGSLLQAAWALHRGGMAMPAAVRTVSRAPALACGLDDRGEIAPGLRADLLRVQDVDGMPVVREVLRGGRRVA